MVRTLLVNQFAAINRSFAGEVKGEFYLVTVNIDDTDEVQWFGRVAMAISPPTRRVNASMACNSCLWTGAGNFVRNYALRTVTTVHSDGSNQARLVIPAVGVTASV